MRRHRNAKIVATLGPASSSPEIIRRLFEAGADVFRLNFSHGTHEDHKQRYDTIRAIERETGRPIGVLVDLQGPKLRVGAFADGRVTLDTGAAFGLDLDGGPGDERRVSLPHPEIFQALSPGVQLLLDDGKVRLEVESCGPGHARDARRRGRPAVRPQGRQRRRRRAAALGPHAQGPDRPRLRAGARRRTGSRCPSSSVRRTSRRSAASSPAGPASCRSWRSPPRSSTWTPSWPSRTR